MEEIGAGFLDETGCREMVEQTGFMIYVCQFENIDTGRGKVIILVTDLAMLVRLPFSLPILRCPQPCQAHQGGALVASNRKQLAVRPS